MRITSERSCRARCRCNELKGKLGLSTRKKVPVIKFFGYSFLPHKALELMVRFKWLKVVSETSEQVVIEGCGQKLVLLKRHAFVLINEWNTWEKYYLTDFPLEEKTVLDVGAGCGESAFFYFLHGADKVVAIECNVEAVERLVENAHTNRWNIEIIAEPFKSEHLEIPFDFMKMDIEGNERQLLAVSSLTKPCVVEVHNNELRRKFQDKGFRKTFSFNNNVHIMTFMPSIER